jgi:hypothetical protein
MFRYKIIRFSQQKEFTRAEKRAMRELHRKIYVPGGLGNPGSFTLPQTSSTRDVLRFNKLGLDLLNLSAGNSKSFDRKNAKTLLQNAGMPLMAGQVDHLVDKYTNKRALVRLKRLKERNPNWGVSSENIPSEKRLRRTSKAMRETLGGVKERMIDYQNNNPRDREIMLDMMKTSRKDFQTPVQNIKKYYGDPEGRYVDHCIYPILDDYRKPTKAIGGRINLGYRANEGVLAHEMGHAKSLLYAPYGQETLISQANNTSWGGFKSPLGKRNKSNIIGIANSNLGDLSSNILTLSQENSANRYGNNILKKSYKRVYPGKEMPDYSPVYKLNMESYIPGIIGQHVNNLGSYYYPIPEN